MGLYRACCIVDRDRGRGVDPLHARDHARLVVDLAVDVAASQVDELAEVLALVETMNVDTWKAIKTQILAQYNNTNILPS